MTPKHLHSIQVLRAVAALMVLSCHIGSIEGLYTSMRFLPEWGMYGVDLFFVISGFVMAHTTRPDWGNPKALVPFLLKRIGRIYPVYWQFTAVILVVMLIAPTAMNMTEAMRPSILKSLLLWPQIPDPLLGVGWSLVYEMYFYLVFCLAFVLPRAWLLWGFVLWYLVLLMVVAFGGRVGEYPAELKLITSPLAFEFMLGCVLAWVYNMGKQVSVVLLVCIALLWCAGMGATSIPNGYDAARHVLCAGVPATFLLYAVLMLERRWMFPGWLRALGDASYSLYLCHSLILSALGKLWQTLHPEGVMLHGLFIVVCAIVPIMVALANYRYFERPFSRWYHRRVATTT